MGGTDANTQNTNMKLNQLARQTTSDYNANNKVNRCNKHTFYYQKQNNYSANKHTPQTKIRTEHITSAVYHQLPCQISTTVEATTGEETQGVGGDGGGGGSGGRGASETDVGADH